MFPKKSINIVLAVMLLLSGCTHSGDSAKYLQCVPYARAQSGIQIYGDAHTWWGSAPKNKYKRGYLPRKGAVLVLSKTQTLEYGHIAVVKKMVDKRNIIVAHANWGNDILGRGLIFESMPVKDVSKNNDWSKVKFMIPQTKRYGYTYPVNGFVYNRRG